MLWAMERMKPKQKTAKRHFSERLNSCSGAYKPKTSRYQIGWLRELLVYILIRVVPIAVQLLLSVLTFLVIQRLYCRCFTGTEVVTTSEINT